jgi:WD40 repeat protein/DNA-binding SARP family transcriptional activator
VGVGVLGPLSVDGNASALGPRDRVVLSALALGRGEVVSAERLADALWGDEPPASWSKVVQGCVARLRKLLGPATIETVPRGYRLALPVDEIDAHRFERLLRRGHELMSLGEPERAAFVLGEALALWQGRALADLEGWEPGRTEAARLEELRLEAEEARLDAVLRSGGHREVLGEAQSGVAEAPLREHRWALLALAQYQAGRQGDALRTLHQARTVLAGELGLDPGPDLISLEQAILRQDPSLAPPAAAPEPSATCPYLGLVPYDVGDADGFFGRDDDVAACLRRLAEGGVLTVTGPSGSGKSSLVRAGIAAALRRESRRVVVITPGPHPMDALSALPSSGPVPVLVVDQCEEAVALCHAADERARFFDALGAYAERSWLVVALRADRLGDVSAYPVFARLVERSVHLLGPMDGADLRAAIEGPARQAGLLLEAGLVDLLVRDVEGEPGALPLLSHALRQTWERREGRTLTVAAYRETGGIRGAVAKSAEQIYAQAGSEQRLLLRDLLLRLVEPGAHGEPIPARVPRRLVATSAQHEQVIDLLVGGRLITSDDGMVELAHEALAQAWPRLRDWLDDDVEGQRILRHLTVAADSWDTMARPTSELYRGARLAQALDWRERATVNMSPVERDFLDASRQSEENNLRETQAQVRRERRTVRRLRGLAAGIAALVVVAAGTSVLAVNQRDRAEEEATVAEARRVGAQALVAPPYDRALLLAVEGVHAWDSPETRGNLVTAIGRSPRAFGVIRSEGARLLELEMQPDGRRVAVVDNFDDITSYDLSTRTAVASLGGSERGYRSPEFSPDGERVVVSTFAPDCWRTSGACSEFGVETLDARDLSPLDVSYEGLGAPAADLAYAPTGELVAAIAPLPFFGAVDNIAVWQVDQPDAPITRLSLSRLGEYRAETPDGGPLGWIEFSPDGTRLYASAGGPTVVFDVATGNEIGSFDGIGALALSSDGRTIAVATTSTGIGLFDTATGELRAELVGHDGAVTDVAFNEDGSLVATVSNDETAGVWDVATGEQVHLLEGHAGGVLGVAFSADGSELYTAGSDRSLMLWDLDGTRGLARDLVMPTQEPTGGRVVLSPAANSVALLGASARLLDVENGALTEVRFAGEIAWAAYRPDGQQIVAVDWDGALQLADVSTGRILVARPSEGVANNGAVAFSPDGDRIVVANVDGSAIELEAESLEPTGRTVDLGIVPNGIRMTVGGVVAGIEPSLALDEGTDVVFADLDDGRILHRVQIPSWGPRANFSPDGRFYGYGGFDGRLGVIDVASGKHVGPAEPVHEGPTAGVTFSPDSRTMVSMGFDGHLALSDSTTATPRARVRPGPPNLGATVGYRDDHTLVVAYEDGSIITFETDATAWEEHACAVAGRNLTPEEWRDAFGDRPYRETCPSR